MEPQNYARILLKSTVNNNLEVRELELATDDSDTYLRSIANVKDSLCPDSLAFDSDGE